MPAGSVRTARGWRWRAIRRAGRWPRSSPNGPATGCAPEPGPAVTFQLLWYPSTMWDTSLPSFAEKRRCSGTRSRRHRGVHGLVCRAPGSSEPPADLAPGAPRISGLAPAYIAIAGHDLLRDDGAATRELLSQAGVEVELHNAETLVHGYLGYSGWCRPPPRPPTVDSRRCGRRCTPGLTSNVCPAGYDKTQ